MGMTLWIHTLEGREMSKESDDHSALYDLYEEIDARCQQLGVTPISTFFDTTDFELNMSDEDDDIDEVDDELEEDPETGYNYGIDDMKWFDAKEGLATFLTLREYIASGGALSHGQYDRAAVVEEIDDFIARLEGPSRRAGKFNLPVVM